MKGKLPTRTYFLLTYINKYIVLRLVVSSKYIIESKPNNIKHEKSRKKANKHCN